MASVLAIVSKALFEKMVPKDVQPGVTVVIDRYKSANKAFEGLAAGDAIFLVTVRPPDEKLWLVGILESPARTGDDWVSKANATPIADVTAAIGKLVFESGTGIKAKKGALGMSLQTPRTLTPGDVALLRGLVPKAAAGEKVTASEAYREAVEEAAARPKDKAKGKKAAGGLRLEHARKPFEGKPADLEPYERKQLAAVVDGGDPDKMFGDEEWESATIVDVVDDATDEVKYQMHLFGYGDGCVFANETTDVVASICQHGFDNEELSKADLRAFAAAWAKDAKRLKLWVGHIDWADDEGGEDD